MNNEEPELTTMQRSKVELYCRRNNLSNPFKPASGRRWFAKNAEGKTVTIPMSAYKPIFPG